MYWRLLLVPAWAAGGLLEGCLLLRAITLVLYTTTCRVSSSGQSSGAQQEEPEEGCCCLSVRTIRRAVLLPGQPFASVAAGEPQDQVSDQQPSDDVRNDVLQLIKQAALSVPSPRKLSLHESMRSSCTPERVLLFLRLLVAFVRPRAHSSLALLWRI